MQLKSNEQNRAKNQALRMLEESEVQRAQLRFEKSLQALQEGNSSILNNREFTDKLAPYLLESIGNIENKASIEIIEQLFLQLEKGQHFLVATSIIENLSDSALNASKISLLKILNNQFCQLLEKKKFDVFHSTTLREFLEKSTITLVRSSQWDYVEKLLSLLWIKRKTVLEIDGSKTTPFEKILREIGSNEVIEKVLQFHNGGKEKQKDQAKRCIKYLGEKAIRYLLNRLIYSVKKEERFLLMEIIGGFGVKIAPIVKEYLDNDMEWYVIRNLIFLVAEIGDEDNYYMIEGFLLHSDIRVQQQIVTCIVKLKGKYLEKRLVQALSIVHDEIKLRIVMLLGDYDGEELANGLIDLIQQRQSFVKEIKDDLVYKICISLRSYSYPKVLALCRELLQEFKRTRGEGDRLTIAVRETIQILAPQVRHRKKGGRSFSKDKDFGFNDERPGKSDDGLKQYMKEITEILAIGDNERATSYIYEKIVQSAKAKDFQTAEALRDKLLDINPNALQDAIQLSEMIEEEKDAPESSHAVEIWDVLYEKMSTECFDAFYYALYNESYQAEETIIDVGEIDSSLYFVKSGLVRLSCKCGDHETFLKRLKSGDIAGISPFFSASVWTVRLTALKRSELHVLKRNDFLNIASQYPELEHILREFCEQREDISNLIKMSGKDRRNYARYAVNVTVNNILLDPYGGSGGRRIFKGEMIDISRGGLAFTVRISNKENAHLLLGRQLISEINLQGNEILKCFGVITGVRYRQKVVKEFSVHVKFYSEIEQYQVADVLNLVI